MDNGHVLRELNEMHKREMQQFEKKHTEATENMIFISITFTMDIMLTL